MRSFDAMPGMSPGRRSDGVEFVVESGFDQVAIESADTGADELAHVLLKEGVIVEPVAVLLQCTGRDARTLGGGDADAMPVLAAMFPFFVEEASLAPWGGDHPEISLGGYEHGEHRHIHFFRHTGGFVDDEHRDRGEAADFVFRVGNADDTGAVGQEERKAVVAVPFLSNAEAIKHLSGALHPFAALAKAGAGDEDFAAGLREGAVNGFGGRDGGLAPLTGAVEQHAAGGGVEDFALDRIEVEAEACPSESHAVQKRRVGRVRGCGRALSGGEKDLFHWLLRSTARWTHV